MGDANNQRTLSQIGLSVCFWGGCYRWKRVEGSILVWQSSLSTFITPFP